MWVDGVSAQFQTSTEQSGVVVDQGTFTLAPP
jgi:hypothetical protein